jgi:tetratricopeptide (TPR) repeat protein
VFRIQEEISRAVADTLQVALGVGDFVHIPGMTRNVAAYEAWLEARSLMNQLTIDGFQNAAERLELAIERDPTFFGAWAESWNAHMNVGALASSDPPLLAMSRSRASQIKDEIARRFPDLPAAREFLASIEFVDTGSWMDEAIRATSTLQPRADPRFERVVAPQIFPDISRLRLDKAREAIAGLERGRTRDPLNINVLVYLPEAYANAGRLRDALEEQDRGWKLVPSEVLAANGLLTAMATGDRARVRERWEWLNQPQLSPLARALYPLRHQPAALRAEVRRVYAAREPVASSQLALWSAAFGEPELALEILRGDTDVTRRVVTVMALWRPIMSEVRRLPGFKDLVRDWGFVDYWKQYGWGDHCRPLPDDDFECS